MFTLWTGVTQYLLELETKAHWGLLLDCEALNISELRDRRGSSAVEAVAMLTVA